MTSSPTPARRPMRVILLVVWAAVALAAAIGVLFGALTAALNGAGFETTVSDATPLFVLCLIASVGAGVCGILLGGRWWTAPLVAAPALLFAASWIFSGQWVSTPLTASPIVTAAGVVCVLVLPRRRAAAVAG
ncbi:hypothetical protein J2X63_000726 [Agromyces sp. 3263]|uniref:hypothetical protein n=1 Tax=Agromyces sp. 3263 TaxID=2817750 RepID=UPI00285B03C6|nr:hypothetical protein [Agromyces sp. 3263]MDR6905040.1 hypothetical protein [Agromyces sp. 3263]